MKKIGKYRITGLLGRGGMSKVYKVEIPVIRKTAALKLLEPNPHLVHLIGWKRIRRLFVSEAVTTAKLRHPNIVEIWDFDENGGKPFYIMDYYFNNLGIMIGETYRTEMPSRLITIDKALDYTRQMLEGLACLHHAGIIHRDIKPFNILLTNQDTVKICDFGLSKLRGEDFQGPPNLKVGSPWYAAPEQEDDPDGVDAGADIYSVGVTLYRMLSGTLPMENFTLPSRLNPDLDKTWDLFIARAITPDRKNRFADAHEMLSALHELDSAWQARKEKICAPPPTFFSGRKVPSSEPVRLRTESMKVRPRQARTTFGLDDLWRPLRYIRNDFKVTDKQTVTDAATGLLWQLKGSAYPLQWHEAFAYIDELNRNRFAGHRTWRLPTVDELMSLLTTTPRGENLCIESVFDRRRKRLWSSDRRSFAAAWYVSVDMGFVWWQDFSGYYYVKDVCKAEPIPDPPILV